MKNRPSDSEIDKALDAHNAAAIIGWLAKGLDANRKDSAGDALLHHAARQNDTALADAIVAAGGKATSRNDALETPADVAAVWGHDALAQKLRARAAAENTATPAAGLPYKTLQDIRHETAATGVDQFYHLARLGRFADVAKLAATDASGLTAADLLGRGPDGDTTILKICQSNALASIIKPELWLKKPEDFQSVWQQVPEKYREGHDIENFLGNIRQARLQAYAKPKLGGFKK
ncbi:MAG: ankyrin repeat domain-containing protein [Micavibrio sp.]|nr:ankyrin repeat domain-containing protein [Micavibrio sp.]